MKYLRIIPIFFFVLTCGFASKQEVQSAEMATLAMSDTITPHIVPSVEDTVKQQLGGKLYFLNKNERLYPSDSITVIDTIHRNSNERGNYRQYSFIVHNKNSQFHKPFTTTMLEKKFKAYVVEDPDLPHLYSEANKEWYDKSLAAQKNAMGKAQIDPVINDYVGHWIYLKVYEGQFYIDHDWAFLPSFHISEDAITARYMDGLNPMAIESFEKEEDGDLLVKMGELEYSQTFRLIDKELGVYEMVGYFMVPAKNVHLFEIIEHVNNTGDLMVTGLTNSAKVF